MAIRTENTTVVNYEITNIYKTRTPTKNYE
jgi:hypothetical protein